MLVFKTLALKLNLPLWTNQEKRVCRRLPSECSSERQRTTSSMYMKSKVPTAAGGTLLGNLAAEISSLCWQSSLPALHCKLEYFPIRTQDGLGGLSTTLCLETDLTVVYRIYSNICGKKISKNYISFCLTTNSRTWSWIFHQNEFSTENVFSVELATLWFYQHFIFLIFFLNKNIFLM